ncbi:MAG TPA: hypothetical protein VFX37_10520 [Pseudolabrys sp.]|nr:hypothetical protein [Pseudolabrys sp.]
MQVRDIRDNMPRTKQTDPNNFPPYEFREYPKMVLGENGKPIKKNGQYVIVNSAQEEAIATGAPLAETAKTVEIEANPAPAANAAAKADTKQPERPRAAAPTKLPADLK